MKPVLPVLMLLASLVPACADDRIAKIDAMIDQGLDQWTAILACNVLNRPYKPSLDEIWAIETFTVGEAMAKARMPPQEIARITGRMRAINPPVDPARPAVELIAYCKAHPDWLRHLLTSDFVVPSRDIEQILRTAP
jgi:hypothetical protein